MKLLESLAERAKKEVMTIVFPEGTEERNLKGVDMLLRDGIVRAILIGDPEEIKQKSADLGLKHISEAEVICPKSNPRKQEYADLLHELRKHKGMTPEAALAKVEDPLYLGTLMIKRGDADGMVSGAIHSTSDTVRPALQILRAAPGVKAVSGCFIVQMSEKIEPQYGSDGVFIFADSGVIISPSIEELAQIAISSAETAEVVVGMEPKIAFTSFSTKGSAKDEKIDRMVEAMELTKKRAPELKIDGELQVDAALDPTVAALKAPGSEVAGQANVLIFPDLQVGNIAYKVAQRIGGALAFGPILQGVDGAVNDLSRGCSPEDIYYVACITSLQAAHINARRAAAAQETK